MTTFTYLSSSDEERRAYIASIEAERDRLAEIIREIYAELYGHGFRVLGWHLNGNEEPLDSWFEDNQWLERAAGKAAVAAKKGGTQ